MNRSIEEDFFLFLIIQVRSMHVSLEYRDQNSNRLSLARASSMQRSRRKLVDPNVVGPFSGHHDKRLAGFEVVEIVAIFDFELVIYGQSLWNIGWFDGY